MSAAAPSPDRPPICFTRAFLTGLPEDLIPWSKAAEIIRRTPHPMSERTLRRKYLEAGGRTWRIRGVSYELVSRSRILEFHRDYWNGWLPISPKQTRTSEDE